MESLVCALSSTKGTVQFDPAYYQGFCTDWAERESCSWKTASLHLYVCDSQKGFFFSACSLFLPHLHAYSAAFVQVSALPQHPWRILGFSQLALGVWSWGNMPYYLLLTYLGARFLRAQSHVLEREIARETVFDFQGSGGFWFLSTTSH